MSRKDFKETKLGNWGCYELKLKLTVNWLNKISQLLGKLKLQETLRLTRYSFRFLL